jgi:hypothetical protein
MTSSTAAAAGLGGSFASVPSASDSVQETAAAISAAAACTACRFNGSNTEVRPESTHQVWRLEAVARRDTEVAFEACRRVHAQAVGELRGHGAHVPMCHVLADAQAGGAMGYASRRA